MKPRNLAHLFRQTMALVATYAVTEGCGSTCDQSAEAGDLVLPGTVARYPGDADPSPPHAAGPDADDEAGASAESGVSPNASEAPAMVDAGSVDEWLAMPCEQSCARLINKSPIHVDACRAPEQTPDGRYVVHCEWTYRYCESPLTRGCASGRRPQGFRPGACEEAPTVGQFFASMAELEHASIRSFRILRRDLVSLGAPRRLLRAASRAARDEVRHTRTTAALARRYGARARPAVVTNVAPRSIWDVALENEIEGCVRETYGALVAMWSGENARDPVVRAAMKRIARDEARHAALSGQISAWLRPRLNRDAHDALRVARARAVDALLREVEHAAPADVVAQAGLPTSAQARALLEGLRRVWERRPVPSWLPADRPR